MAAMRTLVLLSIAAILQTAPAISTQAQSAPAADQMDAMPGMEHHHHDVAEAPEKLGTVSFPTSCAARSIAPMERGVALLHSFGYTEARSQFQAIARNDSTCAMAHWGVAMTAFQELWGRPGPDGMKLGTEEMAKARALATPPAKITPREQAYIAALSAFFDPATIPFPQRADAYEAQMNALHAHFPGDVEAAAFDSLSILASTPVDDTSLTHEHQALAILIPLFAAHPEHPGLAHYIIHTCDTPALAPEGLSAAREYAKIAPSSPHALHMPGHIFARLGMWPEDIDSNLASVTASEKAEAAGQPGSAHQVHAEAFLIYAYLQVGDDARAETLTAHMRSVSQHVTAMPGMDDMKDRGPWFDNEVHTVYAAEMHDWHILATQPPAPGTPPTQTFFTYWGQGVAAGHLHDATLTTLALQHFDESDKAIKQESSASFSSILQIMRLELVAWQASAENHPEAALASMRQAADQQDKLGQMEVDIPAREMLGDLLLLGHRPEAALTEYRTSLKLSPNRLNGLLSAGLAAEQAKHPDEALAFYKLAAHQTDLGQHSQRPELAHAVQVAATDGVQSASAAH